MIDSEEPSKRFPGNRGAKRGVIIHTIRLRHVIRHFRMLLGSVEISLNRYNNAFLRVIGAYHAIGGQLRSSRIKQIPVVVTVLFAVTMLSAHYSFAEEGFAAFNLRGAQDEIVDVADEVQEDDEITSEASAHALSLEVAASSHASEQEASVLETYNVPITAYSSTPDQTWGNPFITASGTRVRDGIIAANFLPLGTKVRIPEYYGDKVFVVEDRMNSRYWYRADIWMETRHQALQWGIRHTTIEVIR